MSDAYYVVRGAKIYCDHGTHIRRLDMPVAHGSYIRDKPMMNEMDCKVGLDQNIAPFGACYSETNENPKIEIAEANMEDLMPAAVQEDGTWVMPELPLKGKLCKPVLSSRWQETFEETRVDGKPALTVNSLITCSCGGVIQFMDNGQEID